MSLPKSNTVDTLRSPEKPREDQLLSHSHIAETNQQNVNEITEKRADSDVPTNEPNIIRKFTKCPELEGKLKINYNSKNNEDHDLDYESYGEYLSEDYCSEDENYDEQYNNANGNQTDEQEETNEADEPESLKEVSTLLRDENSKKFKYMMCALLQEIKKALTQVRILW